MNYLAMKRTLLFVYFFVSTIALAHDFEGKFKVTSSECEKYVDMSTTPINCNASSISITYMPGSSSIPEKICIEEVAGNKICFGTFTTNNDDLYSSGTLVIQGNNAIYEETKQDDAETKDVISWKLEERGTGKYKFTKSIQHSAPFPPLVSGTNSIFNLSK